jgi:hypothetical protein
MHFVCAAQYFIVGGQVQVPAMQGTPVEHTFPQEPQLSLSFVTSLQTPPHSFCPGEHSEATHVQLESSNV